MIEEVFNLFLSSVVHAIWFVGCIFLACKHLRKSLSCLPLTTYHLPLKNAEVVKLANTLRSGRSGRKLLRVQLPSSAILLHKQASPAKQVRESEKRRFVFRQTGASV